jgi:hypothetical protein
MGAFAKTACAAAAIAFCVPTHASAQTPEHHAESGTTKHVVVRVAGPHDAEGAASSSFSWTEHDGAVTQAPYSADAVTEVTQTLADGNRINRRTVSRVYRDAAGRVRREQAVSGAGPLGAAAEGVRIVVVQDPVAKVMYTLDPTRQEARKLPMDLNVLVSHTPEGVPSTVFRRIERNVVVAGPAPGEGEKVRMALPEGGAPLRHLGVITDQVDPVAIPHGAGESLGTRTIEGVEAQGTRWANVIPAGAVGNERPIEVVTERWFSPELKVVVLAKHSDPRLGETVYQLTGIVRQEPPPDLFMVPPDYKVVETPILSRSKVVKE